MANFIEATSTQIGKRKVETAPATTANTNTALTPVEAAQKNAEKIITAMEANIVALSDKDFARRLAVNALTALKKDDGGLLLALQTFKGKKTFRDSILASAEMGLQIDGTEGCLVIYGENEVHFQPMWQGLTEIAYRTGIVKSFDKGVYKRNDDFEWNMGKITKHIVKFGTDRGDTIGYWVRANLANGGTIDEFKTVEEIEKVHAIAKAKNGPWKYWYDEMAFKTVFRSLCKLLPKTEALSKVLAYWDSDFDFKLAKNIPEQKNENPFIQATQGKAEVGEVGKEEEPISVEAEIADNE